MNAPFPAPPQPKNKFPTWIIVVIGVFGFAVVVAPILAVLAVYGVRKYLQNAKTAEARATLGAIAKSAATAYVRDHAFCPSASHAVPSSMKMLRGMKYQSSAEDWSVDEKRNAGFACLGFSIEMPQYYQYSYEATGDSFTATAHGDLNGDGVVSTFVVRGRADTGVLSISPQVEETDPAE
jgi:type IV pilus assembly protein PilA